MRSRPPAATHILTAVQIKLEDNTADSFDTVGKRASPGRSICQPPASPDNTATGIRSRWKTVHGAPYEAGRAGRRKPIAPESGVY
jgi:hypothetical protein